MVCRYTFTGPSGDEITLEGIPALKAYLATGGLDYLLPERKAPEAAGPKLSPPRFYSQLERSLAGAKQTTAPADNWLSIVNSLPGVKKDEVEWSGLKDYLALRGKEKITKAELNDFLALNNVKIQEVTKGGAPQIDYSEIEELPVPSPLQVVENDDERMQQYAFAVKTVMDGRYVGYGKTEQDALSDAYSGYPEYWTETNPAKGPKFTNWTLPGGTNDREMMLTLPAQKFAEPVRPTVVDRGTDENGRGQFDVVRNGEVLDTFNTWSEATDAAYNIFQDEGIAIGLAAKPTYLVPGAHQYGDVASDVNRLLHMRMNDRIDAEGNKVLFIEEIQSDWGQAMRAGQIVPAAPFLKNTKDWVALGVKRIMLLAAQEGYDKVAFVNGEQSADRYNLAKQIDYIEYDKTGDNQWFIKAIGNTGQAVLTKYQQSPAQLEEIVGKEVAEKIVNNEGSREAGEPATYGMLRNEDLKVGGEGMKSFYDRIVPQVVSDVLKKLGGKMENVSMNLLSNNDTGVRGMREHPYAIAQNLGEPFDGQVEVIDRVTDEVVFEGTRNEAEQYISEALGNAKRSETQPGFTVTTEMRDKLQGEGLPLFSRTRTPAFQDWFGDSVLTKDGEPQVLYHGTADIVNAFDLDHPNRKDTGWLGTGVYLTDDPELASAYASAKARGIKPRGQNVMPLYARLENPYVATPEEKDAMRDGGRAAADAFTADLISRGHDGVILELMDGVREIVVFDPAAVKSATGNVGTYSRETTDIRYSNRRAFGDLTPEQEASLAKVGAMAVRKTLRQRMQDLKETFQKSWQQGIFDQFAPLKNLSQEAYMMARLSKGSDGTMEAAMLYGKPFIGPDGVPDVDINDKGFAKTLASLKGEHDRFLWWVAAQRAGMLKQQGLENLFDWGDISNLVDLNQGNFADGTPRAPVYAQAFREMSEFNDAVLKVAKDSGLIDQKAVDLFKGTPYVPFYRVMDGDQMRAGKFSSGLVNQTAWKKLKGGKEQLSSDLLANVLLNWSHLYTASANNRAAVASMQAASDMQIAYEVPASAKKSVRVMVNGEAYHYVIEDPYVMEAVTALEYVSPSFFKPFSIMKRWLTTAVTADPAFKVKNLIRDSISAISQSDLKANPFANIKQGLAATSKEGQTYASMLAGGGLIRFGSMVEGDRAHHARRLVEKEGGVLLDKKGWEKLSSQFMSMLSAYNELGDRMENVNRAALYEQLLAKGHSKAEANFMARDLMDFSMSGRWPVIRFLSQTVPFMNARLQGLYKLGRAANENPKRFGYVVGAVALASIALMLAYEDDEDWKKRPDWDRDANWWFKIGDTAFRIPKPFEVGAIGTIAERTWELFFNKEMTGRRYRERISNMIFDTFAMDPTPQIVKPLLDVYANKVGFTGRPIETMGQQKLRPEERVSSSTSQVAKFLGQLGLPDPAQLAKGEYKKLSPVQVDYLIRGYFGWLGTSATTIVDYGIRPMLDQGDRPDMRLKDVFFVGKFVESLPSGSSRYVDQMYQQATEIEQAYASWREALKSGDTEKAKEIFEDEREKIVKHKMANKVTDRVGDLSRQIKQIQVSKSLSGETKRRMIDQLEQQKDLAARALR